MKMPKNEDLWYRIGYALEATRNRLPPTPPQRRIPKPSVVGEASHKVLDAVLTVGAGTVLTRLLSLWPGRHRPGLFRLFRAGAAGAAAALLAELLRPAIAGATSEAALEEEIADVLLAGAGRGLMYSAIVEPRIPGHPALRGALYGALEYALTPWGGLEEIAGTAAPHRRIPALAILLRARGEDEELLQHLVFGLALALLYDR